MLIGNVFYFMYDLVKAIAKGKAYYYLGCILQWETTIKFFVFNDSPFAPHMWYLGAELYVLLIVGMLEKIGLRKILLYITPLLLLGDLVLGKYSLLLLQREFPYVLVRNWLFVGIPYFSIGSCIRTYSQTIKRHVKRNLVILGCVALIASTWVERFILLHYGLNAMRDHYVSTTFLAVLVFLLFLYYVNNSRNYISDIGKYNSTWIYILHYSLISVMGFVVALTPIYDLYLLIRPIAVFLITILVVKIPALCFILKEHVKYKHEGN